MPKIIENEREFSKAWFGSADLADLLIGMGQWTNRNKDVVVDNIVFIPGDVDWQAMIYYSLEEEYD